MNQYDVHTTFTEEEMWQMNVQILTSLHAVGYDRMDPLDVTIWRDNEAIRWIWLDVNQKSEHYSY